MKITNIEEAIIKKVEDKPAREGFIATKSKPMYSNNFIIDENGLRFDKPELLTDEEKEEFDLIAKCFFEVIERGKDIEVAIQNNGGIDTEEEYNTLSDFWFDQIDKLKDRYNADYVTIFPTLKNVF